jgi:hypothetical protein
MNDLIAIAGVLGLIFALLCYALLYGERQGWVTPLPSGTFGRELRRDTGIILIISVGLIIYSQVVLR